MKKNNSNKVKLGASDKIVRGFGYVVITIYALAWIVNTFSDKFF